MPRTARCGPAWHERCRHPRTRDQPRTSTAWSRATYSSPDSTARSSLTSLRPYPVSFHLPSSLGVAGRTSPSERRTATATVALLWLHQGDDIRGTTRTPDLSASV